MKKARLVALANLIVVVFLFVVFSYFVQTNLSFFEELVVNDFVGIAVYFFLHVFAIVIAPITVFPLIAVATGLWGWVATFFITLVAWEVGAILAFVIARKWGVPLVKRLIPLKEIYKVEEKISKYGNGFWEVLFLRMIIPIDGLSYAIGLFSKIGLVSYSVATFFGSMPFLFAFSYFGAVNFMYQLIFVLVVLILFLCWFVVSEIRKKS